MVAHTMRGEMSMREKGEKMELERELDGNWMKRERV